MFQIDKTFTINRLKNVHFGPVMAGTEAALINVGNI
jgi:hypothetical protein